MSKFAVDDNGVTREIISRKEAIEKGLKKYFTGKPCKHGHVSERLVSWGCSECLTIRNGSDYRRAWRKENKEHQKEYNRRYYMENSEQIKEKVKQYYLDNYEKCLMQRKQYYQANKEHWKEYNKEYRKANKTFIAEREREYERNRYSNDPDFKLSRICKSMLKRTLKATSSTKQSRTYEMLGYCHEQLKQSIYSKFLDGMSWDNYGELWHIDHVYPVARYISDGIKDPAIINHLDNLIPMWAEDNLDKSSMTLEEYLEAYPEKKEVYGHFLN